jgi:hypothetical protein
VCVSPKLSIPKTHEIHKTHVKISQKHNREKKQKTKQNFKAEIMNDEIKKAAANNTNNTTATPPNQPTETSSNKQNNNSKNNSHATRILFPLE